MNQVKSPKKIQLFIFIYAGNEQAYQSYFMILIKCIYFYYLPACVYVNHVSAWFPQKTEVGIVLLEHHSKAKERTVKD